jgi:HEAT repeat protein
MSTPYAPPLDRLLTLGERVQDDEWLDYLGLGIGREHIPELVRMAGDESFFEHAPDAPEIWAPLHALRALGQLRDPSAVEPLLARLASFDDENWDGYFSEELAPVMGLIGPAALPALTAFLAEPGNNPWARGDVARAIRSVADKNPDSRGECVGILTRQLEKAEENSPNLNTLLITSLIDLKAVEAAAAIEAAFSRGLVDEWMIGDLPRVKYELGLGPEPPRHSGRFGPRAPLFPGAANARERAAARRKKAKAERRRKRRR